MGDLGVEAFYLVGLGRAAHGAGRLSKACDLYRAAAELYGGLGVPRRAGHLPRLAGVGVPGVGGCRGCPSAHCAGRCPPGEHRQRHYGVPTPGDLVVALPGARFPLPAGERGGREGEVSDDAWRVLDRAREAVLAPIANLTDDGLRRNYLNKVAINRQIVEEWLREASRRGLPLAPLTGALAGPGGGEAQFGRMLDIGLRCSTPATRRATWRALWSTRWWS